MKYYVLYARVSSDDQKDRETIQTQLSELKLYAEAHGIDIAGMYLDDGISGTIPFHSRPSGARLIADAKRGQFKGVLCLTHSRIGRTALVIHLAVDQIERELNLDLIAIREPVPSEMSLGAKSLMRAVYAGVSQYYREDLIANSKAGMERAAREGRWLGGRPPFGYKVKNGRLVIHEEQAVVVRKIFSLYLSGTRMRGIVKYLNAHDIPHPMGWYNPSKNRRWYEGTIGHMLKNPLYLGNWVWRKTHGGAKIIKAPHLLPDEVQPINCPVPQIINEHDFNEVARLLKENRQFSPRNMKKHYLLRSGLIRCEVCGNSYVGLTGAGPKKLHRYYRCISHVNSNYLKPCGNKGMRADWIEEEVWKHCVQFVRNPGTVLEELRRLLNTQSDPDTDYEAEREKLAAAIRGKAAERERVIGLFRRGKITVEEAERELDRVRNEILQLERERDDLSKRQRSSQDNEARLLSIGVLMERIAERVDTADSEMKREIVLALVERITASFVIDAETGKRLPFVKIRFAFSSPDDNINCVEYGAAYSNNLTIDGLDNNDDRAARERFHPSLESIAEVQVITNQFSAEYGRASGGRINLHTRSGSNRFRGRFFYFYKSSRLNANTFRNNSLGLRKPRFEEHNPGFTLSGPLLLPKIFGPMSYEGRARTFFFVAYEHDRVLDSALIDTLVPVEQNPLFSLPPPTSLSSRRTEDASQPSLSAEIAPFVQNVSTPLINHILTARVDHKFTELHNAAFLYQLGRLNNRRQFAGGNHLAEALQGSTRSTDALAYSDNFVFNAKLVNQLRAQVSRLSPAFETSGGAGTPVVLITINDPLPASDVERRTGTLVAGSSTAGSTERRESRFQIQDVLSYLRGAHSLKFGADFHRISSTFRDLSDISGTFSFASAGDFLSNRPSRFRQNFQTESVQRNSYVGVFVQDEWRVRSNFMLSYGLRYEHESILHDANNFGPRVALAYDPFRSGKTVVRAGFGVFYNRVLLRTLDDFQLGRQRLLFDTDDLKNPATGNLMTAAERRAFIAENIHFPETLTVDSSLVRQFGTLNTDFSRRRDAALRIPESYQANLGFERDLGRGFVVELNLTWNRAAHLWREFNANAPRLPSNYKSFTDYLLSRDFQNFRMGASGVRPIYNASTAGELVRFALASSDPANPNAIGHVVEFGVPVSVFNLNSVNSTTALEAALAALNELRPDPSRAEVEQLVSAGNSFYRGMVLELRRTFRRSSRGLGLSFRAAYTLSSLIDDGVVNTSDALRAADFRRERARSLLDRRHRFVFSGTLDTPRVMGGLRFSPILRVASGAPFNISIGGADRNLDDVSNDRPNFSGDTHLLRARRPGQSLDASVLAAFSLPVIGSTGNLPRNAAIGPKLFTLDLNITREFRLSERVRLRPTLEIDNVLNHTVFSFGAEFVDFKALSQSVTPAQRKAFEDSFLVPTRTLRPREVRLGIRFDF